MKTKAKHPWEIRRAAHRNLTFWVVFLMIAAIANVAGYRYGVLSLWLSLIGLEVILGMTFVGIVRNSLRLLKAHWLERQYHKESQPIIKFAKKVTGRDEPMNTDFVFNDEFGLGDDTASEHWFAASGVAVNK